MCAEVLEGLGGTWWSASTMAKLARKALLELEKATKEGYERASTVSDSNVGDSQPPSNREGMNRMDPSTVDQVQPSQVPMDQYNQQAETLKSIPPAATGSVPSDSMLPRADEMEQKSLTGPNPPYPAQGLVTNQAEIENIDVYLGNFLDLQPSRLNEDPSFLEYMDGLSQEYFDEMAKSTQPAGPGAGAET